MMSYKSSEADFLLTCDLQPWHPMQLFSHLLIICYRAWTSLIYFKPSSWFPNHYRKTGFPSLRALNAYILLLSFSIQANRYSLFIQNQKALSSYKQLRHSAEQLNSHWRHRETEGHLQFKMGGWHWLMFILIFSWALLRERTFSWSVRWEEMGVRSRLWKLILIRKKTLKLNICENIPANIYGCLSHIEIFWSQ